MGNDKVIVAIELGSSKISGIAGQHMTDGSLKVMAYAWTPSASCIKHGAVYNIDKTANAIADVICKLEGMLSARIETVYVGYNAKGLRSTISKVSHKFDTETIVSQEVIDDMFEQCSNIEYSGYENLFQESQEYSVDNKRALETDPIGVACHVLEGSYLNILLKKQVADYMSQCFRMAQVQIQDGYVAPIVQAEAVLTDDDRQQGCALVDYGADTVTVSVYKNGLLRYLRVIPMGSALITHDLASILKIETAQAEQLKCTYGLCNLIGRQDNEETLTLGERKVSLVEISNIIEARNEEIVRNVVAQLKASGYYDVLYAGIVLTGGGSQLRQLDQVFVKLMPSLRKPRNVLEPLCGVVWSEPEWKCGDSSQLGLLSVLSKGDENCCKLQKMDALDYVAPEDHNKMGMQSIFTDDGESAQMERDRKEQEERERKEREESERKEKREQEETANSGDSGHGGKKKSNMFKRFYDKVMDMTENLFDEDGQANTVNGHSQDKS